jgi:hypothetical protein
MKQLRSQKDPRAFGYGDLIDSYPFYGQIQPTIPGFKEIGQYNPTFWPFDDRPLPTAGQ